MKPIIQTLKLGAPRAALLFGALGCAEMEQEHQALPLGEATAALEASTVIQTVYDDSASPVHIQIRSCRSSVAATTHQVDCRVDPEYAVVGGGATTSVTGTNAGLQVLTESRPTDGRTWRASSADLWWAQHELTVHAIGMRLEGVNTQTLRNSIEWKTQKTASTTSSATADADAIVLAGGALAQANPGVYGYRPLITHAPRADASWKVVASDQFGAVPGTIEVSLLQLDNKTIEGFGVLEVLHKSGPARSTSGGTHSTTLQVDQGWAMIAMGASAQTSSGGPLRVITSMAPCATGRCATVTTGDQTGGSSAGSTIAYVSQIRKKPGSHGLCNAGSALLAGFDTCVASVCAVRNACCTSNWDSTCVQMVPTVCGRSCADHSCVRTEFEPERWNYNFGTPEQPSYQNSGRNVDANCAAYALNRYGGTKMPGDSLNLLPEDAMVSLQADRQYALAQGEGLIPIAFDGVCSENRTKLYWGYFNSNFHWRRLDSDGRWSEKWGNSGPAQLAESFVPAPTSGGSGYFCACNLALPDIEPPFNP